MITCAAAVTDSKQSTMKDMRKLRDDEISEKTQSHVTATIVRVLRQYRSTDSNTNHLGESKDKAGRAVDRYVHTG